MAKTTPTGATSSMLPLLYAGAFVVAFNSSVVNVAVPAIM